MKNRYFIALAFKGTAYHGWQIQPNARSVQDEINRALSMVCKEEISTVGAGRTDTGVHARFFVAHFESSIYNPASASKTIYSINSILPDDIAVFRIFPVAADTHARFSALTRTYEYRIALTKNPFEADFSWHCPFVLDIELMNKGAALLLETDDFKSFCKYHSQARTSICRLHKAVWTMENDMIIFTIEADRFLRNMVRAIVGTLIEVGRKKLSLEDLIKIIEARDRKAASWSAPAAGLSLTGISYPLSVTASV
jgi:tRNA pseudouridine38-40 synthase